MANQATYDDANLILRLYELRREETMRKARQWFASFPSNNPDEIQKVTTFGTQENAYMRMVLSYWEMVASIVNRGQIDDELIFENNGEIWVVWDRIRSIVPTWRAAYKNPMVFHNLEEACKRLEAWREKRAPGANTAMRQMMQQARGKV